MMRSVVVLLVLALVAVSMAQRVRVVNAASPVVITSIQLVDGPKNVSVSVKPSSIGSYKSYGAGNQLCASITGTGAYSTVASEHFCSTEPLEANTDYTLVVMAGGDNTSTQIFVQLLVDEPQPPQINTDARVAIMAASADALLPANSFIQLKLTSKADDSVQYMWQLDSLGMLISSDVPADVYVCELLACTQDPQPESPAICSTQANSTLTLVALSYYSLFVAGPADDLVAIKSTDETFEPSVFLRVLNLAPALLGQNVDVYMDSTLTIANLPYATSLANYTQVFQSSYTVRIVPVGGQINETVLAKTKVDFTLDTTVQAYTLMFASAPGASSSVSATLFDDDISAPSARYQRVRVINGVQLGAVAATIFQQNAIVPASESWSRVKYEDVSSSATLPAGNYSLSILFPGNTTLTAPNPVHFADSCVYTIFTYLTAGATAAPAYFVSLDYAYPTPLPTSMIRLINGAILNPLTSKQPTLSLQSGNDVLIKNVSYGRVSKYVSVESSSPDLQLYFGTQLVWSSPKALGAYNNYTLALMGSVVDGTVMAMHYADDLLLLPSVPRIRLLNLNVGTVSSLLNGSGVTVDAPFMTMTPYLNASGKGKSLLTVTGHTVDADLTASVGASLKNGHAYTVIVFGQGGIKGTANVTAPFSVKLVNDFPQKSPGVSTGLTALELTLIIGGSVLLAVIVLAILILGIRKRPETNGYETLTDQH